MAIVDNQPVMDNCQTKCLVGSQEHFGKFFQERLLHGYQEIMNLICTHLGTFKLKKQEVFIWPTHAVPFVHYPSLNLAGE